VEETKSSRHTPGEYLVRGSKCGSNFIFLNKPLNGFRYSETYLMSDFDV